MKHISLSQLATELKVNKSKLAFFFTMGLISPEMKVGRMNIFNYEVTKNRIKKIEELKKKGKTLNEIKLLLK